MLCIVSVFKNLFRMKIYWIIGLVAFCNASNLQLRANSSDSNAALENRTSPTISVQKKVGNTFYNFVKLTPTVVPDAEAVESTPGSVVFDETREPVFMDDSDDDDAATSTMTPTLAQDDEETEDGASGTESSDSADSPSDVTSDNNPNPMPGDGTAGAPPSEQLPGEAVPGQPEDALDSSSSSSSESDSRSSSSSSSSEEYREAFKRWEHKVKNELAKSNKSKDVLARIYSPLPNSNKIGKIKFSKRL